MGRLDVVLAVLKYASPDLRLDVRSVEDKIRLQKYVYIMERLGLNLGYSFSGYLRGPYSPDLANDYYSRAGDVLNLRTSYMLTDKEREVAEKMKDVVTLPTPVLEALSFLLMKGWLCDDDAVVNVTFLKPHLRPYNVMRAMEVGRRVFGCNGDPISHENTSYCEDI